MMVPRQLEHGLARHFGPVRRRLGSLRPLEQGQLCHLVKGSVPLDPQRALHPLSVIEDGCDAAFNAAHPLGKVVGAHARLRAAGAGEGRRRNRGRHHGWRGPPMPGKVGACGKGLGGGGGSMMVG